MKVVHILYRATLGGAERVVYNLINEQLKNNYQVIGIILQKGGEFFGKFQSLLNDNLWVFPIHHLFDGVKLYRFLARLDAEWIIHSHVRNLKLGWILKPLANPKILTEHLLTEKLEEIYPETYRKLRIFYRLYRRDYCYITSVSQAVKHALVNRFKMDSNNIRVILNGVKPASAQQLVNNGYFTIGNATHFEKIKNMNLFLAIAEQLIAIDPTFRFQLLGGGAEESNILTFIKDRNLDEKIQLLPPQEDMTSFYRQLHLGLITSKSESFCLFAAECLSWGIPVVASSVGGLKEVVSDNECGYLVDPSKPEHFVEKILKLKRQKALYQQFSQQAHQRSKLFWIDAIQKDYHQLYRDALDRCGQS